MTSKKKVPTRSIRIDMPDELRPIYDVCQAALDEILSTDSLHRARETRKPRTLVLGGIGA